jgi:hypothetical protein
MGDLHTKKRRPQICLEDASESLVVEFHEAKSRRRRPRRVIHKNIEPTEGLDRSLNAASAIVSLGDVSLASERLSASGPNQLGGFARRVAIDINNPHASALFCHRQGHTAADPSPAARYEGHASI